MATLLAETVNEREGVGVSAETLDGAQETAHQCARVAFEGEVLCGNTRKLKAQHWQA